MTSGRPGSAYEPRLDTAIRLARWRRLASLGIPVEEIARTVGMPRASLDRMVCRARKAGHPDAIRHPTTAGYGHGWRSYLGTTRRTSPGAVR